MDICISVLLTQKCVFVYFVLETKCFHMQLICNNNRFGFLAVKQITVILALEPFTLSIQRNSKCD